MKRIITILILTSMLATSCASTRVTRDATSITKEKQRKQLLNKKKTVTIRKTQMFDF
jgi:Ni/Co efflux regulator RcnB